MNNVNNTINVNFLMSVCNNYKYNSIRDKFAALHFNRRTELRIAKMKKTDRS